MPILMRTAQVTGLKGFELCGMICGRSGVCPRFAAVVFIPTTMGVLSVSVGRDLWFPSSGLGTHDSEVHFAAEVETRE